MCGNDPEDECPFLGTFPPLRIKAEGPLRVGSSRRLTKNWDSNCLTSTTGAVKDG